MLGLAVYETRVLSRAFYTLAFTLLTLFYVYDRYGSLPPRVAFLATCPPPLTLRDQRASPPRVKGTETLLLVRMYLPLRSRVAALSLNPRYITGRIPPRKFIVLRRRHPRQDAWRPNDLSRDVEYIYAARILSSRGAGIDRPLRARARVSPGASSSRFSPRGVSRPKPASFIDHACI